MNGGEIAENAVGILVPLGVKGTPDTARGGSQNPKQRRGRCPRFAPPFRIWDITHPVGVSGNPACVQVNRRFAPLFQAVRISHKENREIGSGAWLTLVIKRLTGGSLY